jgi:dynein heavy chain
MKPQKLEKLIDLYLLILLTAEDIKLNSTVFHWPDHIKTVFELSTSRIANRRDHIEEDLRKRTVAFEEKLNDYMKEVESFKKKEVSSHCQVNTVQFIFSLYVTPTSEVLK